MQFSSALLTSGSGKIDPIQFRLTKSPFFANSQAVTWNYEWNDPFVTFYETQGNSMSPADMIMTIRKEICMGVL